MLRVRSLLAHAVVRCFATSAPALLTAAEVKGWDVARAVEFAKNLGLDDDDANVLSAHKVNGKRLLNLTKQELLAVGMTLGPASDLAAAIAELPCTTFTLMLKRGGNGKRGKFVAHTFTSSEDFANFASTRDIFVSSKAGLNKGAVRSLADAQLSEEGDFLAMTMPFEVIEERISTLEGNGDSSTKGQEFATTQAIVFEVDGLVVNSKVLLLNEAKHSPTVEDAREQPERALKFTGILANPSAYSSEPATVLPALVHLGIVDVRPVLSGYNFAPSVEEACLENGVLVMKTNGSDYSNTA